MHKMAAFHSMLNRACTLPLSKENFKKEVSYIKQTAALNGYTEASIDQLLKKHLDKKKIRDLTTLQPIREETPKKRAGLTFTPGLSYKIANVMKRYDIEMVPKASGKLSQVLGSAKGAVDDKTKSGIYKIQCKTCPALYIGQTKRNIQERFNEHTAWARKPEGEMKSSVAKHLIANPSHSITLENLSLEKSV
jgi:GIY-YIG catalytic domain